MKKEIKSEPQLIKKHSLFLFSKVNNMPLTEETQTLITDEKAEHALTLTSTLRIGKIIVLEIKKSFN